MLCGENVVLRNLLFFFSLSSKDVNSSSELGESSLVVGAAKVCLGVDSDVTVWCPGREKGEETSPAAELSASSPSTAFLTLVVGGGFKWRVLHVLFTTMSSSSSSSSLTKTESDGDDGLLCGFWDARVLTFAGAAKEWMWNCHFNTLKRNWMWRCLIYL